MELQAELVHAEPGRRVVRVTATQGSERIGSALGEAADAEAAEDRAISRLQARLGSLLPGTPPVAAATRTATTPPAAAPAPVKRNPRPPASGGQPGREESEAAEPPAAPPSAPHTNGPSAEPSAEPPPEPSPEPPAEPGAEPPMDPEDWSQELVQLDLQLQRLGWGREQEGIYLQRAFGHPSRSRLTRWADLTAFLRALEALSPPADPASAPVPLQRRDLLATGDALLERLGWDANTARRFLHQELGASSRQQLDDAQLLQFNMLLEEAWMASQGDMRA